MSVGIEGGMSIMIEAFTRNVVGLVGADCVLQLFLSVRRLFLTVR
jgi:hypothetical protein